MKDRNLQFRVNMKGGDILRVQIGNVLNGFASDWVNHPDENIDLAACLSPFVADQMSNLITHDLVDDVSSYAEGRELFFLGFPLAKGAEAGTQHQSILRVGVLSRKSDPAFIIEANVFPGSSGSPLFTKPRLQFDKNGELIRESYNLLGVVSSYIPYQDVAVSYQTGRPRVVFEDNSGLSLVYKIQHLTEILSSREYTEQVNPIIEHIEGKTGMKVNPIFF